ncbi:hypothetical protein GCM10010840_24110 [Deinococcus aerolatus]|uniref:DUF3224 domain-containing protein n=1 Tax=Deinococcus aerolatus TaxID=522487 RepID=A0ABQ2GC12_9DEIO|nr:DUF3224 domain-containing protein [Deinococcus aerolatus]GGL85386.1 hypothetical protein GCM10010840_24110 [Deinococcus aerolatus]
MSPTAPAAATATGTFTVRPRAEAPAQALAEIGHMLLDKQWQGQLSGQSVVEMLTFMTPVEGSAVYVAVEAVQATLDGRQGRFAFFHAGASERGHQTLTYRVVPDSGSGGLAGLSGGLTLDLVDGAHHYVLEYTLPDA